MNMGRYLGKQPITQFDLPEVNSTRGCRGRAWGCGRLIIISIQLMVALVFLGLASFLGFYLYLSSEFSDLIDQVVFYQGQGPGGTPRFYDRHGRLLFELKTAEKRRWLDYQDIPVDIVNATVAVEDDTFWTNYGLDPEAIAAALISNFRIQPARPTGASTITQQLVRHIAFSYEERITPSYDRKFREIFLAFKLTQQRSKQDIMTTYLNEIYYGNLAYGIEAAAQTYFNKPAVDLTLAEAAFLASLPQSPLILNPYSNFQGAKERQEFVLDLMVDEVMVSPESAEEAKDDLLTLAPLINIDDAVSSGPLEAPHFALYVKDELERRYGPDALVRGGWQVMTSLDIDLQRLAEKAARDWVGARAQQHDVNNASIVILKPGTGEILAMVGSLDYFDDDIDGQVNIALSPRQPGSAIKPVTYAAAMERGWSTGDVIWDVPIELDLGDGQIMVPVNYDQRYHGPTLLRDALANSYNIPPIQLIRDIGVPAFISTGRKMGIESLKEPPGYYGLALTLGGGEVSLLELTRAYATLANRGQRPHLTSILEMKDSQDRYVYSLQRDRIPAANAIDPRIASIITDILDDDDARVPAMGYGNALDLPFPVAAKTGTTTDFRDNWTLGYTPGVAIGVWVGNTDGHPMKNSSGLRGAAPLWRTIMEQIYSSPNLIEDLAVNGVLASTEFQMPPGIEEREVCTPRGTGGGQCTATRKELFIVSGAIHGVQRLGYVADTITNPGAWTLAAAQLSTSEAQQIDMPPTSSGIRPPTPTLCVINYTRVPSGTSVRLFLQVPPYYPDEVIARRWAQSYGYSMAPHTVCTGSTGRTAIGNINPGIQQGGNAAAPSGSVWHIDSPAAGAQVSGPTPIIGTASFNPSDVMYYKLEIGKGQNPAAWTTLGTTHKQGVINGQLELLQADALAPGDYVLRLIVVRNDGNYPTPFSVPITIDH